MSHGLLDDVNVQYIGPIIVISQYYPSGIPFMVVQPPPPQKKRLYYS